MTRPVDGGYDHRPHPVIGAAPCTVEAIVLDTTPTLRVRQGTRLVGYFTTPEAVAAHGVDLSTAIIRGA